MQSHMGSTAVAKPPAAESGAAMRRMLIEAVAAALGVRPDRIDVPERGTARVAFARQLAIYLARTRFGLSFTEAGRLFHRDRTTAAHACNRVEELRDDAAVDALVERLEQLIARPKPSGGAGA